MKGTESRISPSSRGRSLVVGAFALVQSDRRRGLRAEAASQSSLVESRKRCNEEAECGAKLFGLRQRWWQAGDEVATRSICWQMTAHSLTLKYSSIREGWESSLATVASVAPEINVEQLRGGR